MPYAELIAKSNFSFLEGASHPEELVEQAIALGLHGLALSDVNGVYGVAKGYRKAKLHPNFKYIVGAEVRLQNHPPVQLLAIDRPGYARLCRTLTRSHADKDKGSASLTTAEFFDEVSKPGGNGLIAIPQIDKTLELSPLKDFFQDRLYLPVIRQLDGLDRKRAEKIRVMSKKFEIKCIASNDVRYHVKLRKILHDVLRATQAGYSLKDSGYRLTSNSERYLKSPKDMAILFRDIPETLQNTVDIADQVQFSLSQLRYRYPSEWIPKGKTAHQHLTELVLVGAKVRYNARTDSDIPEKVMTQLQKELALVKQLEFEDYFLTIYDIVEFAKSRDILCQGRGSAANSVLCYALGITAIDPIQMELLFERFISAERGEPPDIDVDFEHERREEVIQYIYDKYGRDRAAMVSAVITYRTRSALREVAKAFGVPVGTLSAKKVEREFAELTKDIPIPDLKDKINAVVKDLKGFPRHLSIHSGGFTLSADPIIDIVPVEPARMPGRTIIQWDKYDLDELGLLKVDILSLGMLSALKKTLDMVGMELYQIPHDDPKTYDMIRKVDTVGTFQIESRAQMSMLGRLQPRNFYDLVIEVAIVRPGPIVGKMVHPYLRRRRGEEKIEFPHPEVERVLKRTLGVPLFQEQVMKLAINLAGFTPGEADELRRSIAAWRSSGSIEKMGDRLRQGLLRSGLSQKFADQFFEQIQGFAHYGFPESHAASFALLAYASCFLKCHYPAQFTASLVNSQPMGFYSNHTLLSDVERHGVKVTALDLRQSKWDCEVLSDTEIRLGFRVVSGLAETMVEHLLRERDKKPFQSLYDFLSRTRLKPEVNHRLAMAGAFSTFALEPREALWKILEYETLTGRLPKSWSKKHGSANFQYDFFETPSESSIGQSRDPAQFDSLSDMERLQEDFRAFTLTTQGHPMKILRQNNSKIPRPTILQLKTDPKNHNKKIKSAGMIIVRQKPPTAKGVCFCTMEDESGFLDLTFWPKIYDKYKHIFLNHAFIIVSGTLQKDHHATNLLVDRVRPIFDDADHLTDTSRTYF